METLADKFKQRRDDLRTTLDRLTAPAIAENRSLTPAEAPLVDETLNQLTDAEKRYEAATAAEQRQARADEASKRYPPTASIGHEPVTYDRDRRGGPSFLADLITAGRGDYEAMQRLRQHTREVAVVAEERARQGRPELRDLNRTDGTGGSFVPPVYLVDDYVALARAARPTADACTRFPMPPGTDSIVLPKVSTGTSTAIQTADNAAVSETDLTDQNLTAPVRTIAGQQDVAIQVLEQSPDNTAERAIFNDLLADYATKLNVQVLNGSGAAGQATGILQVAGIGAVTYTDASPTLGETYPKLANALSNVATGRFLGATHLVMHPRRWNWALAALDSTNRPLVLPGDTATNAAGLQVTGDAQGVVGRLLGCTVIADPSIPTNLGAGTNEDIIIAIRAEDVWVYESAPRMRVLHEVGSGTLTSRLQVYGYLAVHAARYPSAVCTVGGTGLITPTW